MKKTPWTEEEVKILQSHLDLTISGIIENRYLPGRTYWQIYNWLSTHGYRYSFKEKRWFKEI